MKLVPSISAALVVMLLVFGGCSDDPPTSAGTKVLPPRDGLKVLTFDTNAVVSSTYLARITGNSTTIMAGKFRDIQTRTLLQFYISIGAFSHPSRIDSAVITMPIIYRYKDTTAPLAFQVFNMRRTWGTLTATWDTLITSPIPYTDTVVGSFSRNVTTGDSSISVPLDTNMVREWSADGICSVVLIPTAACGQLVGFDDNFTTVSRPELVVAYHDSLDSAQTSTNLSTQRAFVANCSLPPVSKEFFVQGGVSYRGKLLFNVSGIPSNASIVSADLQLHIDTVASIRGDSSSGNILAQVIANDSTSPALGGQTGNGIIDGTRSYVSIPINNLVQEWVTRKINYGVSIRLNDEFVSVDRFTMYGVLSPYKFRPHLHIRYTVLP